MGLSRMEQEVHILKTADEKEWMMYSSDPKYIRKMDKIGVSPYKKEKIDNDTYGYFYKIEEKQISFRKKRILTEEQKKKMKERMLSNINKDK